ncbi:hypothetical protein KQI65_09535 [bacterium]|nr:hypothetical protein [bacterium]
MNTQRPRIMQKLHKKMPGNMQVLHIFVVLLLLPGLSAVAQSREEALREMTDREFVDYLRAYRSGTLPEETNLAVQADPHSSGVHGRCGFTLGAEVSRRLQSAPPTIANEIRAITAPQAGQVSIVSPSGRFRVHYDTSGEHTPALLNAAGNRIPNTAHAYADSVAQIFDAVYALEVEQLGYESPPYRSGENEYQLYVEAFRTTDYGYTQFGNPLPTGGTVMPLYAAYMQIDNDFQGYPTSGLEGLRVTAAHEFHHMVQLGSYGFWSADTWFHEMASTYYEEVCYPEINDYHQYIQQFVRFPDRPWWQWMPQAGYELALWPLYLQHQYDQFVFRETWENMKQLEPITATRDAIRDHQPHSGDMAADVCNWARANFFIGYRAGKITSPVYDDAADFRKMSISASVELVGESATLTNLLSPLSAHYLQVYSGVDTLSFVVANTDIASAITRSAQSVQYELIVRRAGYDDSYTKLSNGWAYRFNVARENALCVSLVDGGTAAVVERTAPFPNPFNPREFSRMSFPLPRNIPVNRANLYIYSVSMNLLVRKENVAIELDDNTGVFVGWDGRSDNGEFLGSGVYIYMLTYQGGSETGKFAVVTR